MSRHHLRAGFVGWLLKYFKAVLSWEDETALDPLDDVEPSPAEDLELLHTLSAVWIGGEAAQRFYRKRDPAIAASAAREIRQAILGSVIYDCELSLEQLQALDRIEARHGKEPPGCPSKGSTFLTAALAKVRHLMRAIRELRPLRSPSR